MKIGDENLFSVNVGLGSKKLMWCKKILMWYKTTRNKGTGRLAVYISYSFIRSTFRTGNIMYQKTSIFHLILLRIPSSLVLFVKNRAMRGGVYLTDKIC